VDCPANFSAVEIASNMRFRVVHIHDYGDDSYHASGVIVLAKERVNIWEDWATFTLILKGFCRHVLSIQLKFAVWILGHSNRDSFN